MPEKIHFPSYKFPKTDAIDEKNFLFIFKYIENKFMKMIKDVGTAVISWDWFVGDLAETCMKSALVYMVRIPGFHPGGPGSIPGCGTFYYNWQNTVYSITVRCFAVRTDRSPLFLPLFSLLGTAKYFRQNVQHPDQAHQADHYVDDNLKSLALLWILFVVN